MPFLRSRWFYLYLMLLMLLSGCAVEGPARPPTATPPTSITPTRTVVTHTAAPTGTPTQTPEPVSHLKVDVNQLDGQEITLWHPWSGAQAQALEDLIAEFNAENEWGIQARLQASGSLDDLSASVQEALEAGEAPDLAVGYTYQAAAWQASGPVVDLGPFVDDPIWGLSAAEQDDFYPAVWQGDVLDGARLGFPAWRSGQVLFYNQSWAEALGFKDAPQSASQFSRQACAAAEANRLDDIADNDGTGGYLVTTNYSAILSWIYAFGGRVEVRGGDPYRFDTQEVEDTFTFHRRLFDQGCAWLPTDDLPQDEFAQRRALFYVDSLVTLDEQKAAFRRSGLRDEWTVIPFPPTLGGPALDVYGPSYVMLAQETPAQLASWLLVRWLADAQQEARLVEASGSLPLRQSTRAALGDYAKEHTIWAQVSEWLPDAHQEPAQASWRVVRWTVFDAATQLYRYYFEIDQVPQLVELLEFTANDLHNSLHDEP